MLAIFSSGPITWLNTLYCIHIFPLDMLSSHKRMGLKLECDPPRSIHRRGPLGSHYYVIFRGWYLHFCGQSEVSSYFNWTDLHHWCPRYVIKEKNLGRRFLDPYQSEDQLLVMLVPNSGLCTFLFLPIVNLIFSVGWVMVMQSQIEDIGCWVWS